MQTNLSAPQLRSQGWWLARFYGISIFAGYLTPNPFLCKKSVLFQKIQFSMPTQFNCQTIQFIQTVLIQPIQFSVNTDLFTQ